ncbi:DUF1127 domain-containing protein [Labrys monachus]|uniref:Uncharacterized protein YjiS (DUF1127 family) n=1 Tax=Labrys monachus TaxID=217067 RepID=A0ABU0FC08_9HYPH|nr:DUF1127 domain-containing protein [Labrys monachus]MDQ0392137.1 uncharacterized protein YjiS (DUF1127 family) [Labrys monachus]
MRLEEKSSRTAAAHDNRSIRLWEGEPLDLAEALPSFMFRSGAPVVDDRAGRPRSIFLLAISSIVEGFALYGASMHPEVYAALDEDRRAPGRGKEASPTRRFERPARAIFPPACSIEPIRLSSSATKRLGWPQQRGGVGKPAVGLDPYAPIRRGASRSTAPLARLLSMLAMPWRGWVRATERRRARVALETLDDRLLRDIGLLRHDIDVVTRYWRPTD